MRRVVKSPRVAHFRGSGSISAWFRFFGLFPGCTPMLPLMFGKLIPRRYSLYILLAFLLGIYFLPFCSPDYGYAVEQGCDGPMVKPPAVRF